MPKASFAGKHLLNQIPYKSFLEFKMFNSKQRSFKPLSGPGGMLGFFTIIVAMLLWNWKLLLALLVGVGVMLLVYSMQKWDWQLRLSQMWKFLNSPNCRLALAVGSGGIATVSTYMAAAIWVDAKSSWIAAGAIVQGLGTLLTLILLLWQIVSFHGNQEQNRIDQLLVNLTDSDPLKRLIAIRQLTKIISSKGVDSQVQAEIIQCLRLLLHQEPEAVIRDATLDSLQVLDSRRSLPLSKLTNLTPLSTKLKVPISSS
ncbi:armadillo-type fold-containing protein [Nodularia sp. UHCC 0506]|uniref:armadillo-type fold-containing protein n=1 Tax=Nodularia sp. UHCC 0506 TaxID=3110243 RepID=UPI002B1FD5DF|nr:armadillo-type fold-containing protein [Nodularia sp. UHCC 0506]MEA5513993.1 armadillo-type fold-containing protein [Nodularia sp. UHCC 0506]